jgi:hypothetical protein
MPGGYFDSLAFVEVTGLANADSVDDGSVEWFKLGDEAGLIFDVIDRIAETALSSKMSIIISSAKENVTGPEQFIE